LATTCDALGWLRAAANRCGKQNHNCHRKQSEEKYSAHGSNLLVGGGIRDQRTPSKHQAARARLLNAHYLEENLHSRSPNHSTACATLRQLLASAHICPRLARRKSVAQALAMTNEDTAKEVTATRQSEMTDKELVFDLLHRLPDNVTIYEIAQKIEFIAAIRQGLAELDSGRSVSIEQIERDLASWSVTVSRKRRKRRTPQTRNSIAENKGALKSARYNGKDVKLKKSR
jgi:hypothetical protein